MKTVLVFAFAMLAASNAANVGAPEIKSGDEYAITNVQKIMRLAKRYAPLITAQKLEADYSCDADNVSKCINGAVGRLNPYSTPWY